jgi:hypothetical protein
MAKLIWLFILIFAVAPTWCPPAHRRMVPAMKHLLDRQVDQISLVWGWTIAVLGYGPLRPLWWPLSLLLKGQLRCCLTIFIHLREGRAPQRWRNDRGETNDIRTPNTQWEDTLIGASFTIAIAGILLVLISVVPRLLFF